MGASIPNSNGIEDSDGMPLDPSSHEATTALLLIDVINDLDFEGSERMLPDALKAADAISALKSRAKASGIPVIYVNDNFGHWRSDFREVAHYCSTNGDYGRQLIERLAPDDDDFFVLKPKHSGFYNTTLETLLRHLGVRRLILTGFSAHVCVLFTAGDAYMRDFALHAPEDCTASPTPEENEAALAYMKRVQKVDLTPSTELDLDALAATAPSAELRPRQRA